MKKLLVLLMVLGLVATANATIKLQVNGQDVGSDISLMPSDTITIGIYNIDYVLMTNRNFPSYVDLSDLACFSVNNLRLGAAHGDTLTDISYASYPGDDYGEVTMNQNWNPATPSPVASGVIGLFNFHCELQPNVVVVTLYDYNANHPDQGTPVQTLTIHQIPEPITVALLGLGGLFLRRRK